MLEGPYHSNRWQERWLSVERVLLLLQTALLFLGAIFIGYDWFIAGHYFKLAAVFGSGVVLVVLTFVTRSPLFLIGIVFPAALARFWP